MLTRGVWKDAPTVQSTLCPPGVWFSAPMSPAQTCRLLQPQGIWWPVLDSTGSAHTCTNTRICTWFQVEIKRGKQAHMLTSARDFSGGSHKQKAVCVQPIPVRPVRAPSQAPQADHSSLTNLFELQGHNQLFSAKYT